MRRSHLLLLCLLAAPALAENIVTHDKDTLLNDRYIARHPEEAEDKPFKDAEEALPPLPSAAAKWFDLYIAPDYPNRPAIELDNLHLAADNTVRYTLNTRSAQGLDNLTTESLYCSDTMLSFRKDTMLSSYKILGYGDPVNQRWIQPRNPQWQKIGSVLNSADPIRAVLYRAFCEDGLPANKDKLIQRLQERAGSKSKWTK